MSQPSLDNLPTEIREQIWSHALGLDYLGALTIPLIVTRYIAITQRLTSPLQPTYTYVTSSPPPSLPSTRRLISKSLRTLNHRANAEITYLLESRRVKQYIEHEKARKKIQVHNGETIYFNPKQDTISMGLRSLLNLLLDEKNLFHALSHANTGLQNIRRLELPYIYDRRGDVVPLCKFPQLEMVGRRIDGWSTGVFGNLKDVVQIEMGEEGSIEKLRSELVKEMQEMLKDPRREVAERDLLDDLARVWRVVDGLFGAAD